MKGGGKKCRSIESGVSTLLVLQVVHEGSHIAILDPGIRHINIGFERSVKQPHCVYLK